MLFHQDGQIEIALYCQSQSRRDKKKVKQVELHLDLIQLLLQLRLALGGSLEDTLEDENASCKRHSEKKGTFGLFQLDEGGLRLVEMSENADRAEGEGNQKPKVNYLALTKLNILLT